MQSNPSDEDDDKDTGEQEADDPVAPTSHGAPQQVGHLADPRTGSDVHVVPQTGESPEAAKERVAAKHDSSAAAVVPLTQPLARSRPTRVAGGEPWDEVASRYNARADQATSGKPPLTNQGGARGKDYTELFLSKEDANKLRKGESNGRTESTS